MFLTFCFLSILYANGESETVAVKNIENLDNINNENDMAAPSSTIDSNTLYKYAPDNNKEQQ